MTKKSKLAIVIPIYNEAQNLPQLCRRLTQVCDELPSVVSEVIFVNDGSTDESAQIILEQRTTDPRFGLVELTRNFGHQAALSAGLAHCNADAVITMDGDLQDPPEVIPELLANWRSGGQVVLAVRQSRREKGFRRMGLEMFHALFSRISDFPIPANTGTLGLFDKRAVAVLNAMPERNRFIPGLRSWIGFDRRTVYYDREARLSGAPKQTVGRLIQLALDAVFSFSYKPLRLMTLLGSVISMLGFVMAVVYVGKRLVGFETAPTGFTTLVTLILFLGGIQLISVGLLGEYLGRIYDEVKERPLYIVSRRVGIRSPRDR